MSAPKLRVLISGAGIAGPCLAYWLARTKLQASITIVERSPTPRLTGQSIDMGGPAVEVVKRMKLEEAILSRHTTEEGTTILSPSGTPCAQFGMGDTFTNKYEILRADLSEIFLEATEKFENIKYIYGDSIKSLEQTEKNVHVTFAKGSKETFDLVVAADGSTSPTRSMILDQQVLKDSYNFLGWYIAFFSISSQPDDSRMWQIYNAPKGLCMMIRPHRNPATMGVYLGITMPAHGTHDPAIEEAMEQGTEATKRILHKYFENAGWQATRILKEMDTSEDFYMARAAQVKLPKWTNGRALLVGDAAHATFGEGTSLAIESAYLLAGELSKIRSTDDVPQALESFEAVFRPLYSTMMDLPPGFPQSWFPQTAFGLKCVHWLIWFVSKTKLYKLIPEDAATSKWKLPDYDWNEI